MRRNVFSSFFIVLIVLASRVVLVACDTGEGGEPDADLGAPDSDHEPSDGDIEAPDGDVEVPDGDSSVPDGDLEVTDGDVDDEPRVELEWGDCDLSEWPPGYPPPAEGVQCTLIEAPLDYENPDDETIWLTVARHPARNDPGQEAVFVIAGGPGGTSVSQSGSMPYAIPGLLDRFDLVYLDQRGTGGSNRIGCPDIYELEDLEACGDANEARELNHFRSVNAAHDFELVSRAMGYERISLIGGSYGVRLALEIVRQHEDIVHMAVLSGVMSPDTDWLGAGSTFFDRGVDMLVDECSGSDACLAVSPNLESDLDSWRQALREGPRPINIEGHGATVEDEGLYLYVLARMVGEASLRSRVPRAIHDAMEGDTAGWNRLMTDTLGIRVSDDGEWTAKSLGRELELPRSWYALGDFIAWGIYMTVLCGEYLPNSGGIEEINDILDEQQWPNDNLAFCATACPHWQVDPISEELRQPVVSDVASLLVSGQYDINTISEWGDHTAETLSNSTHIVVPHATHLSLWGECPARIVTDFLLADGDPAVVDTSCLETIPEPSW